MEKTNARFVPQLPDKVEIITIDASFISLKILLPVVKGWFGQTGGWVIALIKPQFEAGRSETARGDGIIRDPEIHRRILEEVLSFARQEEYGITGVFRSPLLGPKGNVEYFGHLAYPSQGERDLNSLIRQAIHTEGV